MKFTVAVYNKDGKRLDLFTMDEDIGKLAEYLDRSAELKEYCRRDPKAPFKVRFEDEDGHGGWLVASGRDVTKHEAAQQAATTLLARHEAD